MRAPRRAVPGAPEPTARAGCMAQFTRPPPRGSEPRERGMGAGAKNFRRNLARATCDVFPPAGNTEGAADDTTCTGRQAPPLPSRDVPATRGKGPVPVRAVEVRPPQRCIACPARVVELWEGESEGAFPGTRAVHVRSGSEGSGPLLCISGKLRGHVFRLDCTTYGSNPSHVRSRNNDQKGSIYRSVQTSGQIIDLCQDLCRLALQEHCKNLGERTSALLLWRA